MRKSNESHCRYGSALISKSSQRHFIAYSVLRQIHTLYEARSPESVISCFLFKIPVSSLCLMAVQYVLKSSSSSFIFSILYSNTFQKVNQISNHSKLFNFLLFIAYYAFNANSISSNCVYYSGWMLGEQLFEDLKGISRSLFYFNSPV